MIQEMKGTLYMIYANYKLSLLSFWSILAAIVVLSIVSVYVFQAGTSQFTLSAPMYFYTPIVAGMVVTGVMPFMIKQGVTRLPIFLSLGLFLLVTSILNAVVVQVFIGILKLLFGMEHGSFTLRNGESVFSINHPGDLLQNANMFTEMTIDIAITMFISSIVFVIALIFYRYGKLIAFTSLGILGLLFAMDMTNEGAVYHLLEYVFTHFTFGYFYYLIGISIGIFLISYVFIHRLTIKK